MKLNLNISEHPVLTFDIDINNKTATLLNKPDERIAKVLLTPEERNFTGLTRRLNEFMGATNVPLTDILQNGLRADFQHNLNLDCVPFIKEQLYPTVEQYGKQLILKNNIPFGNTNAVGMQHKGQVILNGQDYFIKTDSLNPTVNGSWENQFDYQYSSVTESIVSALIKNSDIDGITYDYVELNDYPELDSTSATISKNYLKENEVEHVLAIGRYTDPHTVMTIDDYAENIVDKPFQQRLNYLTETLHEHTNLPKENIHQFLIQQAGFDVLVGNNDRLNNPSNFVFTFNNLTKEGRLINFDYGRCIPMRWTKTTEDNYDLSNEEFLAEDIQDFSKMMAANNDSILSGIPKKEWASTLKEVGFKPFTIDINGLKQDLRQLKKQFKDTPFEKYAFLKTNSFIHYMESDLAKQYYVKKKKEPITNKELMEKFNTQEQSNPTTQISELSL